MKLMRFVGTGCIIEKSIFHVIGVRSEDADDYELYITNLPRAEFPP